MEFPNDANGDVFRRMKESGLDFTREHIVDFFAVFPTEAEARQVASLYERDRDLDERFQIIEVEPCSNGRWQLAISKPMLVDYEQVTAYETAMAARAAQAGGSVDGWGVLH